MNTLQEIQRLGTILRERRNELQNLEAQVSAKQREIRDIEETSLPAMMDELNIEAIDLQNGGRIEVKDFIQTSITQANKDQAFAWLRETNNDSIIKNEISVKLDRGMEERAQRIMEDLALRGVAFEQKQSVHPMTLKSFITEVLNDPTQRDTLPREAFSVYEGRKVVFK